MTRPSSRNGTGCAISFRKIERRWAGWERRKRKKGGSWKEGKKICKDGSKVSSSDSVLEPG